MCLSHHAEMLGIGFPIHYFFSLDTVGAFVVKDFGENLSGMPITMNRSDL